MSDAAERSLDAAYDDRHILECFTRALRVHDDRAVGPLTALASRRIGIVTSDAAIRRVAIDHGVHVAGGDAEEQVGSAESSKRFGAMPIGLRNDPDAETLGLEDTPD